MPKILGRAPCSGSTFCWNPPHTALKVYGLYSDPGEEMPKILGRALCSGSTLRWNPPHIALKVYSHYSDPGEEMNGCFDFYCLNFDHGVEMPITLAN